MGDILDNSVEIISTFSGFFLGGGVGGVIKWTISKKIKVQFESHEKCELHWTDVIHN
jgi:hypothetical protein